MLKLRDGIVELYKKVATSLPPDIEEALRAALPREDEGSAASASLSIMIENVRISRETLRPICQDTGVPVFFVKVPMGLSHVELRETIRDATRIATAKVPLRPNAVDVITEKNSGDNTGIGFPLIYLEETGGTTLTIDLLMKGGGSENVGQLYKLPVEDLQAQRDLEGVRRCVLDAIQKAQGRGCPPYIIGVGIGAAKDQVTRLAKDQLMRRLTDSNKVDELARLEGVLLEDINGLGIGPQGLGGRTTALGVKIGVNHRHPASYFVDVSVSCWANRRGRLIW
ncbi:Fumarate hydratase subunit alpha [Candidatus Sulfobium mesophilum]|uniref:Fumarate hydratase subunit alpha n=1 Tax=Candidatus Sulfobium mesophilum TaxID=2016548 RepID=A0A2U3QIX1_9BACT|nr:Fumarate hydratase subunit alpha [Candidatus Sulfobium mesophilum]